MAESHEARSGAADDPDAVPTIDSSVFGQLIELDAASPGLVAKLCKLYCDGAPKMIDAVGAAMTDEDLTAVAMHAHSLKGSSLSIGAARLAALCGRIESEARLGKHGISAHCARLLKDEFDLVRQALARELP